MKSILNADAIHKNGATSLRVGIDKDSFDLMWYNGSVRLDRDQIPLKITNMPDQASLREKLPFGIKTHEYDIDQAVIKQSFNYEGHIITVTDNVVRNITLSDNSSHSYTSNKTILKVFYDKYDTGNVYVLYEDSIVVLDKSCNYDNGEEPLYVIPASSIDSSIGTNSAFVPVIQASTHMSSSYIMVCLKNNNSENSKLSKIVVYDLDNSMIYSTYDIGSYNIYTDDVINYANGHGPDMAISILYVNDDTTKNIFSCMINEDPVVETVPDNMDIIKLSDSDYGWGNSIICRDGSIYHYYSGDIEAAYLDMGDVTGLSSASDANSLLVLGDDLDNKYFDPAYYSQYDEGYVISSYNPDTNKTRIQLYLYTDLNYDYCYSPDLFIEIPGKIVGAHVSSFNSNTLVVVTPDTKNNIKVYTFDRGEISNYIANYMLDIENLKSNPILYTPSVSNDGTLSWTNNGDLENPDEVNIKGVSGVYVGSGDMPDGYNIQIDPDEDTDVINLDEYVTKDYINRIHNNKEILDKIDWKLFSEFSDNIGCLNNYNITVDKINGIVEITNLDSDYIPEGVYMFIPETDLSAIKIVPTGSFKDDLGFEGDVKLYVENAYLLKLTNVTDAVGTVSILAEFPLYEQVERLIAASTCTPQRFGAVGDGVTDDTTAIQQALSNGGTIYFPEGEYYITKSLYPAANSIIEFDGRVSIKSDGTAATIFTFVNDNVTVYFNGASVDGTTCKSHPLYVSGGNRITLYDVNVNGVTGDHDGVYIGNGSEYTVVKRGRIANARRCGIAVVKAKHTIIDGVEIYNTAGGTVGAGIDVEANTYDENEDTIIRNCHIHDNEKMGVCVSFGLNVTIENNFIENTPKGIVVGNGGAQWKDNVYREGYDRMYISNFDLSNGYITLIHEEDAEILIGTTVRIFAKSGATLPGELTSGGYYVISDKNPNNPSQVILGNEYRIGEVRNFSTEATGTLTEDNTSDFYMNITNHEQTYDVHILNNTIKNVSSYGIDWRMVNNADIRGNYIDCDTGATSIHIQSHAGKISGNILSGNPTTGGVALYGSLIAFENNTLRNVSGLIYVPVNTYGHKLFNNVIENCSLNSTVAILDIRGQYIHCDNLTIIDADVTHKYAIGAKTAVGFKATNCNAYRCGTTESFYVADDAIIENCIQYDGTIITVNPILRAVVNEALSNIAVAEEGEY